MLASRAAALSDRLCASCDWRVPQRRIPSALRRSPLAARRADARARTSARARPRFFGLLVKARHRALSSSLRARTHTRTHARAHGIACLTTLLTTVAGAGKGTVTKVETTVPKNEDQAVGVEKQQLEAAKHHKPLHPSNVGLLKGPFGTAENPVRIPSVYNSRVAGCTGEFERPPPNSARHSTHTHSRRCG